MAIAARGPRAATQRARDRHADAWPRIRERDPSINAFTARLDARAERDAAAIDAAVARVAIPGRSPASLLRSRICSTSPASPRWRLRASMPIVRRPVRDATVVRRLRRARRDSRRRAQHGCVRLRLHDRKHALRGHAQSARPHAQRRWLVRRIRRGSRRGHGAAGARVRYQRFDPGAGVAVRRVRPQAHVRPREPRRKRARSCTISITSVRWRHAPTTWRLPTTRSRVRTQRIRCARRALRCPSVPELGKGAAGLRIAVAAGYFARPLAPEARSAVAAAAAALDARRQVELPHADRARAAAFILTASAAGSLYLPRAAHARRRLRAAVA